MFEVNPVRISHIQRCYDHWKFNDYGYIYRKVFVVEDFYKNPDEIRDYALSCKLNSEKKFYQVTECSKSTSNAKC